MIGLVNVAANGWNYGTHPRKKVEIFLKALNAIIKGNLMSKSTLETEINYRHNAESEVSDG